MHDAHFLCYRVSNSLSSLVTLLTFTLLILTLLKLASSPHTCALQELKDDLLDDTAWPVVMQWFNEDH